MTGMDREQENLSPGCKGRNRKVSVPKPGTGADAPVVVKKPL